MKTKLLLLVAVLVLAVPTFGGTIGIDYTNINTGGSFITNDINYTWGLRIPIGQLTITDGSRVSTYTVVGGSLSLNTDADFIDIKGAVPSLGIGLTNLSWGHFTSFSITRCKGGYTFSAEADETTNAALLAALGLPSTQWPDGYDAFAVTIDAASVLGGEYCHVSSVSVDLGSTVGSTPEPVSVMLLGSFLGLGVLFRRRKQA